MFTQTNPADNPQPTDKLLNPDGSRVAPLVSGPGDRPLGALGVDKPHGGGTMALEQEADTRATVGAQGSTGVAESRLPGPNPNNPQDINNPFSTSRVGNVQVAAAALAPYATGVGGQTGPVTTGAMLTKNEENEDARLKAAAKAETDREAKVKAMDKADQRSAMSAKDAAADPKAAEKQAIAQRDELGKRRAKSDAAKLEQHVAQQAKHHAAPATAQKAKGKTKRASAAKGKSKAKSASKSRSKAKRK